MASRGMSATVLSEIAKGQVRLFHLVQMHFSTIQYISDSYKNIAWDSNAYLAGGNLLSFSSIKEEIGLRVGNVNIALSGVNQANVALALTEDFTDKQVLIYRGFLDASQTVIVDPFLVFDGRIDSFGVREEPGKTSSISWNVASHWSDFDKVSGRRTNNEDQQLYYSGDLGLNHASEIITDLRWGRL